MHNNLLSQGCDGRSPSLGRGWGRAGVAVVLLTEGVGKTLQAQRRSAHALAAGVERAAVQVLLYIAPDSGGVGLADWCQDRETDQVQRKEQTD